MRGLIDELNYKLDTFLAINSAFFVVATIAVALRVYVRTKLLRRFGADDWAMLLTWALFIACCSIMFAFIGEVRDIFTAGVPSDIGIMVKLASGLYILAMMFLKISLGAFFLNIFAVHGWQKVVIWIVIVLSVAYGIVYFVMTMATCGITASFAGSNDCAASPAFNGVSVSWSVLNAVGDFVFSALSVQAIWQAQMPLPTKISASGLLVLGTIGGVASIVRIVMILDHNAAFLKAIDSSYWTIIEVGVGITAASLATLRPLFRSCLERVRHTVKSAASHSHNTISGHLVPSSLKHSRANPTVHDWRSDRISRDLEKIAPQAHIIATATIITESTGRSLTPPSETSPVVAGSGRRMSLATYDFV